MKKRKSATLKLVKTVKNMTNFGPVKDVAANGHMDCTSDLGIVLNELSKYSPKQKVLVAVSKIDYHRNDRSGLRPERVEAERTVTKATLLKWYKEAVGKPFIAEVFKEELSLSKEEALQRAIRASKGRVDSPYSKPIP